MESVEYLVVCEASEFEVVVDISFVQSFVYWREWEFQYFLKAFLLFRAVCENEYPVSFRQIGIELFCSDFEVFVKERLCRRIECYSGFCFEESAVNALVKSALLMICFSRLYSFSISSCCISVAVSRRTFMACALNPSS